MSVINIIPSSSPLFASILEKVDYEEVKGKIQNEYSRENIPKYVEKLKHLHPYLLARYEIGTSLEGDRIYHDFLALIHRFFINDVLNIDDDQFYLIFNHESDSEIYQWMHTYTRHYAVLITLLILDYH